MQANEEDDLNVKRRMTYDGIVSDGSNATREFLPS